MRQSGKKAMVARMEAAETGAGMLSPGVLRVPLIHNSPPWQTFIHILTPHGCAQWSFHPSTSPLSLNGHPCGAMFTKPASFLTLERKRNSLVLSGTFFSARIELCKLNIECKSTDN